MQRYKQPSFDVHPDGEFIRYADHVEAMKRIADDGGQQVEPVAWMVTHNELSPSPGRETIIQDKVSAENYANGGWIVRPMGFIDAAPAPSASPADQVEDARDAARWRAVKPFLRVYTDDFEEREYMPPNIATVLSVSEDDDMMPGRHETPEAWADEAIDAAMSASKEGV